MTCKDCIHERVCYALIKSGLPYDDLLPAEAFCMTFKNKSDVIEVRHGEWQSLDNDHFSCTQCGHIFVLGSTATIYTVKQQWQYCPKCGANMTRRVIGKCD